MGGLERRHMRKRNRSACTSRTVIPCCCPHASSSSLQIIVCFSASLYAAAQLSSPRNTGSSRRVIMSARIATSSTAGVTFTGVPGGKGKVPVSRQAEVIGRRAGTVILSTEGGGRGEAGSKAGAASSFSWRPFRVAAGGGGANGFILPSERPLSNSHGGFWRLDGLDTRQRVDDHERSPGLPSVLACGVS